MCASVANRQPEGRDHGLLQRAHLLPSHCAPANQDPTVFFLQYYREVRSSGVSVFPSSFSQRLGKSFFFHSLPDFSGGKLKWQLFQALSREWCGTQQRTVSLPCQLEGYTEELGQVLRNRTSGAKALAVLELDQHLPCFLVDVRYQVVWAPAGLLTRVLHFFFNLQRTKLASTHLYWLGFRSGNTNHLKHVR